MSALLLLAHLLVDVWAVHISQFVSSPPTTHLFPHRLQPERRTQINGLITKSRKFIGLSGWSMEAGWDGSRGRKTRVHQPGPDLNAATRMSSGEVRSGHTDTVSVGPVCLCVRVYGRWEGSLNYHIPCACGSMTWNSSSTYMHTRLSASHFFINTQTCTTRPNLATPINDFAAFQ